MGSACLVLFAFGVLICGIIVLPLFVLAGVVSGWVLFWFVVIFIVLFVAIRLG